MSGTEVITLQLTRKSRRWFLLGAIVLLFCGVAGALQGQNGDSNPGVPLAIGVCAMLLCAFLVWRMSRRGMGELRVDPAGFVVDSNAAVGRVTWENFEKAGIAKRLFTPLLGIALHDAKAFLDTRSAVAGKHALDQTLLKYGNRVASLYPQKGADIAYKLMGYTPLPQSGLDIDMLAWNRTNFGYDLCISALGVENLGDIPGDIEKLRPAASQIPVPEPAEPSEIVAGQASAYKTCPECAEQVRAAAKICRFCHYDFETHTMPKA